MILYRVLHTCKHIVMITFINMSFFKLLIWLHRHPYPESYIKYNMVSICLQCLYQSPPHRGRACRPHICCVWYRIRDKEVRLSTFSHFLPLWCKTSADWVRYTILSKGCALIITKAQEFWRNLCVWIFDKAATTLS